MWALIYVLSPLLIALFILPGTASVTKALYRSLFEVCGWKVLWVVLSALLWSSSYSTINGPESDVNLFTVVCLNLILAASLLFTPMIVSALAGAGLSGVTSGLMGLGAAATYFNPTQGVQKLVRSGASSLRSKAFDGGKDDSRSRRQTVRPPNNERFSARRDGADASSSFPPDRDGH